MLSYPMRISRFLFGLFTGYLAVGASSSLQAQAFYLSPGWVIHSTLDNPDSYLYTNSTARRLDYNPTTDHILAGRGSTALTQIIVASRATNVVLLTTFDGINFIPHILHTDIQSGDILPGIAFGDGNTFWTKANSRPLRQLSFDLLNNSAKTIG